MRKQSLLALGLGLALAFSGGRAWADHTPLHHFAAHQLFEIDALSKQFDTFRRANRTDAVMVLYHMVRDHALVLDAAENLLARRGVNAPLVAPIFTDLPDSPEALVGLNIRMHEQMLNHLRQLIAKTPPGNEQSIYQRALAGTQKHLGWLRSLDRGQQVQVGFFGPTVPVALIAGYREETFRGPSARERQGTRQPSRGPARRNR